MKVAFRKDKTKKYTCSVCGNQFNWNSNSYWFGSYDKKPEAYICSKECKEKHN